MKPRHAFPIAAMIVLALLGCASPSRGPQHREPEWHPPVGMLLRYDFNHDGSITRAEMEKGLHEDFTKADSDRDGQLGESEARAINQERWTEDASAASPLVDWTHDGTVDFDEFAAAPRSLFSQMDANGDGVLLPQELHPVPAATPHKPPPDVLRRRGRQDGDGDGY